MDLCNLECASSVEDMANVLDKIKFPSLSEEPKQFLCKPISKDEVSEVIRTLRAGKAPGPDGFGLECYKKLSKVLVGPLMDMYSVSLGRGCLPPTLNLASHLEKR